MLKWFHKASPPDPVPQPLAPTNMEAPLDRLLDAQVRILGPGSTLTIIDAGSHLGDTTIQYLSAFPQCRVIALEPERGNHAVAADALLAFGNRVELLPVGVSDKDGSALLHLTSHSGAHSLLEVGDMRFYDGPVDILPPQEIDTVTIDRLCADRALDCVDILKMDIQGGELMALKGARSLLSRGAIRLVVLEVLFQDLYKKQPMFWELADYLRGHGYALQGIYEPHYHNHNPALLCWADAIFVAPVMTKLSTKLSTELP